MYSFFVVIFFPFSLAHNEKHFFIRMIMMPIQVLKKRMKMWGTQMSGLLKNEDYELPLLLKMKIAFLKLLRTEDLLPLHSYIYSLFTYFIPQLVTSDWVLAELEHGWACDTFRTYSCFSNTSFAKKIQGLIANIKIKYGLSQLKAFYTNRLNTKLCCWLSHGDW